MKKNIYKYIKFEPNTGLFRSKCVGGLVDLGVIEMPRPFLHVRTAHLANVYGLVVSEGSDTDKIDVFIENQDPIVATYLPDETVEEYKKEYAGLEIEDSELHYFI
jgi:hypothetical protein